MPTLPLSMVELRVIRNDLIILHKASIAVEGFSARRTQAYIEVGEYGLALDGIAYAYLDENFEMPPDMFRMFEKLAIIMDLADDPEFDGVARLRARMAKPAG